MRNFASPALISGLFLLSVQTGALCQTVPQWTNPATGRDKPVMSDGQATAINWAKLPQRQASPDSFRWDTLKPSGSQPGGAPPTQNVVQASGSSLNDGRLLANSVLPTSGAAEVTSPAGTELKATPRQSPSPIAAPLQVEGKSLLAAMTDVPSEQPPGSAVSQVGLQLETLIPIKEPASETTLTLPDRGPLQLVSLLPRDRGLNERGDYDVGSMFAPLKNASDLVRSSDIEHPLMEAPVLFGTNVRGYAETFEESNPWPAEVKTWVTPTFAYNPLYFEEVNLERYGYGPRPFFQPLASSAHFYGSILILPYKLCTQHPCEKVYPLGYQRPGDRAGFQRRSFLGEAYLGDAFKYFTDESPGN